MAALMDRPWALRGLFFAALGVIAGLGHAPIDWPVATLAALAIFLLLQRGATGLRAAVWHGWAFGAGYFAFTLRWIISPFLVHVNEDGWMAPFAIVLMAGGLALFWALAAGLAYRVKRHTALLLAMLLVLVEALRALIFTGFPWGLLGHVLVQTPFAMLAAYTGPHGLTALIALAAWGLVQRGAVRIGVIAGIAVLGALLMIRPPAPPTPDDAPIVRLVQPNAPQDQKWDPIHAQVFFDRMLGFTGEGEIPDLVVWPESAIAELLNYAEPSLNLISDAARGAPVVVGVNRREEKRYYNGFVTLGRGGLVSRIYDKQHLVPFGEYFPGGEILAALGIHGFASSEGGGFSSGTTGRLIDIPGIGNVRPLICYEGIFAEEIGTDLRPRAMILITNDAWFGKDAGPYQHLAQAQLRAIEQGIPMVRVANTGVSAMIDSDGRITHEIALNTAGAVDAPLPPLRTATVYSRFGDWPVLLGVILAALACFLPRTRESS